MVDLSEHRPLVYGFVALVAVFLALDLGVLSRRAATVSVKASFAWTSFWVALAGIFAAFLYLRLGPAVAETFVAGYLLEQSLSVDNLFVFLVIFRSFKVPAELQHRVLFWGIVGALAMRALCIFAGIFALQRFTWLTYVFAIILVIAGIKTARPEIGGNEASAEPEGEGKTARLLRRFLPVAADFDGQKFFTQSGGRREATPLFLALVTVEVSDLIFAVDSIPAVLSVSLDPFIVYTSNVFAILGLRSIYFALARAVALFRYLRYALAVILVFVGVKMALAHVYPVPTGVALSVIAGVLAAAILASVAMRQKPPAAST